MGEDQYKKYQDGGAGLCGIAGGAGGTASQGFFGYSQIDPSRQIALGHAVDMYRLSAIKAADVITTAEEYLAFLRPQPAKSE